MPLDPAARIAKLEAELAARDAELTARDARLAARDARLAEVEAIVAKQAAQIELLLEKLGKNSSNSDLPPSSDGPGAAGRGEHRRKKPKSARNRGGQKGHRGAHRGLIAADEVQEVVDLFPACCTGCAAALATVPHGEPERYQLVDVVLGGRHVKEWRLHECECDRCGALTRAPYDPAVIPSSPFGPRLRAVVAMLTGAYHISRRQTSRVLLELLAIDISVGSVSNIEAQASAALVVAAHESERAVEAAQVKHADATTWLLAGATRSLWTLACTTATVYRIFTDGRRDTVRPMFGASVGILISDRAAVFDFWAMSLRQVCWAHLLRRFIAFSQRDGPAGVLGRELLDCASLVFEYWHAFRDGTLDRAELASWMRPVKQHVESVLARAMTAGILRLSGSCANILAHREALWTFVAHDGVEPTNNHAESALRPFVLWRKRSFGCQSERGLRFAERMMTVVHTARKQGKDVLDFLVRTITAHGAGMTMPALIGDATPA